MTVKIPEYETNFRYTLVNRGSVLLSWDDIEPLRNALPTLGSAAYIIYNERGKERHVEERKAS